VGIAYQDQQSTVADTGFQARVEAGEVIVALAVTSIAPTGSPTAPRYQLADRVITQPDFAVTQFCWAIVTRPQLTDITQITDTQINNVISSFWDQVAGALFPAGP
jgi:hypothetical protein